MDDAPPARDAGMTMQLTVRPDSPFRFRFSLLSADQSVGMVEHRLWGRPGRLDVGAESYSIERAGPRRWCLEGGPRPVTATPTGPLRGAYRLEWAGDSVEVGRRALGYGMRILDGEREIGRIRVRNLFVRTLMVDVDDGVPIEAIGLALYLTIRMRRRGVPGSGGM